MRILVFLLTGLLGWQASAQNFKGAPEPSKPGKDSPLSLEEQRRSFSVPEGFEVELVAGDPDLTKTITVAFDDAGRMWAITASEYPVDGNENPEAARQLYLKGGKDQVLVFDDVSQPGPHKPRVFVDGLAMPMGVLPIAGGVLI